MKDKQAVQIVLVSELELAEEESAKLQGMWARLSRQIWVRRPWRYNYTVERLLWGLGRNMAKPFAKPYAALGKEGDVIGFTLGYEVFKDDLRDISQGRDLDWLFSSLWKDWISRFFRIPRKVFYIVEFGVDPSRQGEGVGQSLVAALLNSVQGEGIFKAIVLRTEEEALAARHIYSRTGFQELNVRDGGYSGRTWWILWLTRRRWWLQWL